MALPTAVMPQKIYSLYHNIEDFTFSMPGGWDDYTISVFIEACHKYVEDLRNFGGDFMRQWSRIVNYGLSMTSNITCFNITVTMELAKVLKAYLLKNENTDEYINNEAFKSLFDDTKDLLGYFPNANESQIPSVHNKKCNCLFSDKNKPVPIVDVIKLVSKQYRHLFGAKGIPTSILWTEMSQKVSDKTGLKVDVKQVLEPIKIDIVSKVRKETDNDLRAKKFLSLAKDYLAYFDYIPPRNIKRSEFLPPELLNEILDNDTENLYSGDSYDNNPQLFAYDNDNSDEFTEDYVEFDNVGAYCEVPCSEGPCSEVPYSEVPCSEVPCSEVLCSEEARMNNTLAEEEIRGNGSPKVAVTFSEEDTLENFNTKCKQQVVDMAATTANMEHIDCELTNYVDWNDTARVSNENEDLSSSYAGKTSKNVSVDRITYQHFSDNNAAELRNEKRTSVLCNFYNEKQYDNPHDTLVEYNCMEAVEGVDVYSKVNGSSKTADPLENLISESRNSSSPLTVSEAMENVLIADSRNGNSLYEDGLFKQSNFELGENSNNVEGCLAIQDKVKSSVDSKSSENGLHINCCAKKAKFSPNPTNQKTKTEDNIFHKYQTRYENNSEKAILSKDGLALEQSLSSRSTVNMNKIGDDNLESIPELLRSNMVNNNEEEIRESPLKERRLTFDAIENCKSGFADNEYETVPETFSTLETSSSAHLENIKENTEQLPDKEKCCDSVMFRSREIDKSPNSNNSAKCSNEETEVLLTERYAKDDVSSENIDSLNGICFKQSDITNTVNLLEQRIDNESDSNLQSENNGNVDHEVSKSALPDCNVQNKNENSIQLLDCQNMPLNENEEKSSNISNNLTKRSFETDDTNFENQIINNNSLDLGSAEELKDNELIEVQNKLTFVSSEETGIQNFSSEPNNDVLDEMSNEESTNSCADVENLKKRLLSPSEKPNLSKKMRISSLNNTENGKSDKTDSAFIKNISITPHTNSDNFTSKKEENKLIEPVSQENKLLSQQVKTPIKEKEFQPNNNLLNLKSFDDNLDQDIDNSQKFSSSKKKRKHLQSANDDDDDSSDDSDTPFPGFSSCGPSYTFRYKRKPTTTFDFNRSDNIGKVVLNNDVVILKKAVVVLKDFIQDVALSLETDPKKHVCSCNCLKLFKEANPSKVINSNLVNNSNESKMYKNIIREKSKTNRNSEQSKTSKIKVNQESSPVKLNDTPSRKEKRIKSVQRKEINYPATVLAEVGDNNSNCSPSKENLEEYISEERLAALGLTVESVKLLQDYRKNELSVSKSLRELMDNEPQFDFGFGTEFDPVTNFPFSNQMNSFNWYSKFISEYRNHQNWKAQLKWKMEKEVQEVEKNKLQIMNKVLRMLIPKINID